MKNKKKLICAGVAIALTGVFIAWLATHRSVGALDANRDWPDFLTDKQDAPRYNYAVGERDFGYRTGNHVPLTLYFKLLPGMELETEQLVVNGDFNVVSRKEAKREKVGDDTLVRIDLVLQAFVLKPKLEAKPTVTYRQTPKSEPKKLDMLTVEVYTSQTFDGRKSEHPKERADIVKIDDGHLWITLAFIVVGGAGLVISIGALVRKIQPRIKKPGAPKVKPGRFPSGWTAVQEAWAAIAGGDHSKAAFTKLAELSRTFFGVQSLTVSEIERSSLPEKEPLVQFLRICETALWTDKQLDNTDIARANEAFGAIEELLIDKVLSPLG